MKKRVKKLTLSRETLRNLLEKEAERAEGAGPAPVTQGSCLVYTCGYVNSCAYCTRPDTPCFL